MRLDYHYINPCETFPTFEHMDRASLLKNYAEYDDLQLLSILASPGDYSEVAVSVAREVIQSRGGIDLLTRKIQLSQVRDVEIQRVKQEARKILVPGVDLSFAKKMVTSETLPEQEVANIVEGEWIIWEKDLKDRQVKPATITRGIPAVIISGLVAGFLWGLSIMWSGRIFYIFLVGVVIVCYSIVKLFTRQSYKNSAVFVLTVIASILAFSIGQLMWGYFGRQ